MVIPVRDHVHVVFFFLFFVVLLALFFSGGLLFVGAPPSCLFFFFVMCTFAYLVDLVSAQVLGFVCLCFLLNCTAMSSCQLLVGALHQWLRAVDDPRLRAAFKKDAQALLASAPNIPFLQADEIGQSLFTDVVFLKSFLARDALPLLRQIKARVVFSFAGGLDPSALLESHQESITTLRIGVL
jgi:hypothetical protein